MESKFIFTLSVLLLSTAISLIIKYGGEKIAIPPTTTNALLGILGLPLVVGIALWFRGWK